ncbi:class I SAM-dependent methyltransferase [Ramlibacter sp.]|uniref:class I SAM-dependent methyltransferase n=1 Tax=Ramlibacter sp. TaxID=1917967 RepID=UPI002B8D9E0F|nr:class I SAM-dependent methyltransferase [Ramlibacter sp.]HWI81800.1 class I SAM-dependent methyltransferase [Ramlibacter sp.]
MPTGVPIAHRPGADATSHRLRDDAALRAEFDLLADEYEAVHAANVAITGEQPAYFAEYKVADLGRLARASALRTGRILDFGSGIGNSVPFFRRYFPDSELHCADVSSRSIDVARSRFPGPERHLRIDGAIPLPSASQDVVFSACVFHHIPHAQHEHWLAELRRVTRPGGVLAIYEHNPLNPLTVHAVRTCPLDVNARLLRAGALRARALAAGWERPRIEYKLFFPASLRRLRWLEPRLHWLALGAQYRLTARRLP